MKARTFSGTILAFHITDERYSRLDRICRRNGIRLRRVPDEDCGRPLGVLLGLPENAFPEAPDAPETPAASAAVDTELLLLADMNNTALGRFLEESRKEDVVVDHKAMLTPTNIRWTPAELLTELKEEHAAMQRQLQEQE